jgi:hypothetical protein
MYVYVYITVNNCMMRIQLLKSNIDLHNQSYVLYIYICHHTRPQYFERVRRSTIHVHNVGMLLYIYIYIYIYAWEQTAEYM